jgi:DNA polymerase III alpha subunit
MSKFRPDEMERLREQFIAGCQRREPDGAAFSASQAATLWEQVAAFAGYGFNQGHATAYADVSYRSAYLKAHWPAAFLCARLADWGGFHHPAIYMAEAVRLGIPVRPPHVNFSGEHFTLQVGDATPPGLWMGLGAVRDLRQSAIEVTIRERQTRPFASLRDLVMRVSLQA